MKMLNGRMEKIPGMKTYGKQKVSLKAFCRAIVFVFVFLLAFVPSGRTAAEGTVRHLNVEREATEFGLRYALTVDGKILEWGQTVSSAYRSLS